MKQSNLKLTSRCHSIHGCCYIISLSRVILQLHLVRAPRCTAALQKLPQTNALQPLHDADGLCGNWRLSVCSQSLLSD